MMQDQKRAIEPDLGDVDIRDGSGKNGLTVGLLADIPNEALYHLSFDPAALHLG
jgi:hypothetical protein